MQHHLFCLRLQQRSQSLSPRARQACAHRLLLHKRIVCCALTHTLHTSHYPHCIFAPLTHTSLLHTPPHHTAHTHTTYTHTPHTPHHPFTQHTWPAPPLPTYHCTHHTPPAHTHTATPLLFTPLCTPFPHTAPTSPCYLDSVPGCFSLGRPGLSQTSGWCRLMNTLHPTLPHTTHTHTHTIHTHTHTHTHTPLPYFSMVVATQFCLHTHTRTTTYTPPPHCTLAHFCTHTHLHSCFAHTHFHTYTHTHTYTLTTCRTVGGCHPVPWFHNVGFLRHCCAARLRTRIRTHAHCAHGTRALSPLPIPPALHAWTSRSAREESFCHIHTHFHTHHTHFIHTPHTSAVTCARARRAATTRFTAYAARLPPTALPPALARGCACRRIPATHRRAPSRRACHLPYLQHYLAPSPLTLTAGTCTAAHCPFPPRLHTFSHARTCCRYTCAASLRLPSATGSLSCLFACFSPLL